MKKYKVLKKGYYLLGNNIYYRGIERDCFPIPVPQKNSARINKLISLYIENDVVPGEFTMHDIDLAHSIQQGFTSLTSEEYEIIECNPALDDLSLEENLLGWDLSYDNVTSFILLMILTVKDESIRLNHLEFFQEKLKELNVNGLFPKKELADSVIKYIVENKLLSLYTSNYVELDIKSISIMKVL